MTQARDTILIDGKARAAALRAEIAREVESLVAQGRPRPCLRVVIVGNHPASEAYVRTKEKMAREAGIDGEVVRLAGTTSERDLIGVIGELNADPAVHGILVQLPLPDHIDGDAVLNLIRPDKDVDGFHPVNVGRLWTAGRELPEDLLIPCTPRGSLIFLDEQFGKGGLAGQRALVLGRSNIVGKPMAQLLLARDCTVTIAHSRTHDLPARCREADILVAAVGRPDMVRGDWIKPGATVIDVGINRVDDGTPRGRITGDVATDEALGIAHAITPVPGGVGPMTVACLLANTLIAAKAQTQAA